MAHTENQGQEHPAHNCVEPISTNIVYRYTHGQKSEKLALAPPDHAALIKIYVKMFKLFCWHILHGLFSYDTAREQNIKWHYPESSANDIGPVKQNIFTIKLLLFSYPSVLTCVMGAQKNRLNETVLLSTHNICFG